MRPARRAGSARGRRRCPILGARPRISDLRRASGGTASASAVGWLHLALVLASGSAAGAAGDPGTQRSGWREAPRQSACAALGPCSSAAIGGFYTEIARAVRVPGRQQGVAAAGLTRESGRSPFSARASGRRRSPACCAFSTTATCRFAPGSSERPRGEHAGRADQVLNELDRGARDTAPRLLLRCRGAPGGSSSPTERRRISRRRDASDRGLGGAGLGRNRRHRAGNEPRRRYFRQGKRGLAALH